MVTSCHVAPWSSDRSAYEPIGIFEEPNGASLTGRRSGLGVANTDATQFPFRVTMMFRKEPASSELNGIPSIGRVVQVLPPSLEVRHTKPFREKAKSRASS